MFDVSSDDTTSVLFGVLRLTLARVQTCTVQPRARAVLRTSRDDRRGRHRVYRIKGDEGGGKLRDGLTGRYRLARP